MKTTLLFFVALGSILVPVMPAQPGPNPSTDPAGFQSVDAAPITRRVDAATATIMDAFNRRDAQAYLAGFTAEPFLLAPGTNVISGRSGMAEAYLQVPDGLRYAPIRWADRQFLRVDHWIIETGLLGFQFRLAPDAAVMSDPRQVLTIWEEAGDGTLRAKLLAWNPLADLQALERSSAPVAFADPRPARATSTTTGAFAAVLDAETDFHRCVAERQPEQAAAHYTAEAMLIPPQSLPRRGRAAIQRHLAETLPSASWSALERQVAHVEGSENHVLVINLFRWTGRPDGSAAPVPVTGKGVHLWQRQSDGAWRILLDLPNTSEPAG